MTIIAAPATTAHDYDWLKAQVASWLHRSNLTTQIVDFIELAESEINSELRLRLMEVDEPVILLAGERTVALPSRYLEPIQLELVITGRDNEKLTYVSPAQMDINAAAGVAGEPRHWTVNGENLEFPYPADRDYTLNFRMLEGFDLAGTLTNALLTKYPGVYLYGALRHGALYCNDDRQALWESTYLKLKAKANKQEGRTKTLTTIRTDHPSVLTRISNIFRG